MLNQNFTVQYKGHCYMVDPSCLFNSSKKFQELIQPIMNNPEEIKNMQLQINYDKFYERNVENFLKLCQNLPTDCTNSEVKEICEIAKLFQAEQIYSTGINFVHNNVDPNFSVTDQQYNENSYLVLISKTGKSHHFIDMNSLEFDDDEDDVVNEQTNTKEKVDPNITDDLAEKVTNTSKLHSKVYQIKITQQKLKLPVYQFMNNNEILFAAKHKNNITVIGKGNNVHLKTDSANHECRIITENGINSVYCANQKFRVSFVYLTTAKTFSMDIVFVLDGNQRHWKPMKPRLDEATKNYVLPLRGEYNHPCLKSSKNTALVNDRDELCLIMRQVSEDTFEAECNPSVPPIIIFSIAMCQIIGPNAMQSNITKM